MGKKTVAVISVYFILLVAMVAAVTVVVMTGKKAQHAAGSTATSSNAVQKLCHLTDYKETCVNALSGPAGNTSDPKQLIMLAFNVTVEHLGEAIRNASFLEQPDNNTDKDPRIQDALVNCGELLEFSINDLQKSAGAIGTLDVTRLNGDHVTDQIKTWLSGAITFQQTCLDGFENTTGDTGEQMKKYLLTPGELTSNGLAIITELSQVLPSYNVKGNRKLLSSDEISDGFPAWVSAGRRRLLQASPAALKPDVVVVAQDGSGKYKTVNEALKDVPLKVKNNITFVIYVKAGVYKEYVYVTKPMNNVFLIGDGPTKTKITGSRSYVGGLNTYKTATVWANGDHFMAKDIGFENTAGADNHQAVALHGLSDRAIIYNCQIDGYQDTLYTHTYRQFYRDCTISGTVDFIFGNAAAVFQNCKMVIRKPLENQSCMVTAQGRSDKRMNSGIVLQNCTITAAPDYIAVQAQFKSYLGRPWKKYSRTVIMQSQIDRMIDPAGWAEWNGDQNLNTLWYAEISNRGPGAIQTKRVKWSGIQHVTIQGAEMFTAAEFIDGRSWILVTGVPYEPGMINV